MHNSVQINFRESYLFLESRDKIGAFFFFFFYTSYVQKTQDQRTILSHLLLKAKYISVQFCDFPKEKKRLSIYQHRQHPRKKDKGQMFKKKIYISFSPMKF